MPGIDQLKQFDSDITPIGNEPDIRRKNGSTMPEVAIPGNISAADDSYDFEFGLPGQDEPSVNATAPEVDGQTEESFEDSAESKTLPDEPLIPSMEDLDPDIAAFLAGTASSPAPLGKTSDIADIADIADIDDIGEQKPDEPLFPSDGSPASFDESEPLTEKREDVSSDFSDSPFNGFETGGFETETEAPQTDGSLDGLLEAMQQKDTVVRETMQKTDAEKEDAEHPADSFAALTQDFDLDALDDFDKKPDVSPESNETDSDFSSGFSDSHDDFSHSEEEFNLNADLSDELNEGFSHDPDMPDIDLSEAVKDFDLGADFDFSEETEETEESDDSIPAEETDLPEPVPEDEGLSFSADDTNFDNFEIPGFSDTVTAPSAGKIYTIVKKKSGEGEEDFDRTYLSDTEYKTFRKNLYSYPLNVRIAVEQLVVKNEFTDAAVMEVLFKVIKKVSARHLASHLGKMLDVSISVPLNYERRTAEQYELYKTSLEYQLKNRIIPGAIIALILGGIFYIFSYFGYTFVYRPLKAESLYKSGYNLIEQGLYSQSESNFNEALTYKVKKKWFFKYARAYREKRQYQRAAVMYEQLIKRFKFDKQGGLEYAHMEFEDLANYERAAQIVRRFILDYHINDKDAMILLGDIYLEWAGSLTSEAEKADKFEQARLQYSTLMSLYGSDDLYLSRMLRYFIRTDNLRQVLPLKGYFTSTKKILLQSEDLIELGGYLLEKQYGYLPPSDEYLRGYIDNVKKILEQGIKADPSIPEGHYNLSRYFVRTGNSEQAKLALSNALSMFDAAPKQSHARTLKHIDTFRLLGEQYVASQEYLLAEKQYAEGIRLFEQKREYTGLTSNKDVGKLYSDMGDIDYFISGDIQNAFRNYKLAIENNYDTPSIRYRIGFVQYTDGNYSEALGSFIKTASEEASNRNLLLALGNVLSIRRDESAARGYYERLIHILDADRRRFGVVFPQVREDQYALVDLYLKASNNLGVTLARLAEQTGNSALQAQAIVQFSESVRAWDALTRNQKTMVRLEGSNLAAQNIKYLTYPQRIFEPSIYASIPSVLYGEVGLKQYSLE
ncbi:hypothetical protein H0R92_09915 [Treponema sp. OMZ 840]|uniref:periplasmic flagellar collar protein FlcA n=1 Tax=Treponema sp. OMZ 840 TaxID=244313 RepID=UPI003D8B43AD